jgi:hypothetical protein
MRSMRLVRLVALAPCVAFFVGCSSILGIGDLPGLDGGSPDVTTGSGAQGGDSSGGSGSSGGSTSSGIPESGSGSESDSGGSSGVSSGGSSGSAGDDAASSSGNSGGSGSSNGTDSGGCGAPAGWSLVEASFGPPTSTLPTCGSDWTGSTILYDGLIASAATCGCSCTAPQSIVCSTVLTLYGYSNVTESCVDANTTPIQATSGMCYSTQGIEYPSVQSTTPMFVSASCSPNPSTSVSAISWAGQAIYCTPVGTSCAADSNFDLCLMQTGDVSCPSGYGDKHVEYTTANDTRGCSACTCGAAVDTSCAGTVSGYYDSACTVTAQLTCSTTVPYVAYDATPSGGSCPPSSVSAVGTATSMGAMTFCCP